MIIDLTIKNPDMNLWDKSSIQIDVWYVFFGGIQLTCPELNRELENSFGKEQLIL